ncbi:MAG: AAA family ATPase [Prevotella sp.]|nr:AAA family ATPase [Prevotella sp.]
MNKNQKSTTRTPSAKSLQLDEEIKRLLFLNPLMDFKIIKRTIDSLPTLMIKEKEQWVRVLKNRRREFVIETADTDNATTRDCVKDHIASWEQEYGRISLQGVIDILDGTEYHLFDIAPEHVTPMAISELLDNYLIGQPEYSRKLSLCFYLHLMRKESKLVMPKANLLAFGPSGVGKTFGPQKLAELFGLKLGVVNCNNLVQEGIHGAHLTDVFSELYEESDQELEPVESAVILLDEFDKLFLKGEFNERVLNELLNILDDNNSVSFSTGMLTSERVSTKNMLFIFSGVFSGIEDLVRKRLGANAIGFSRLEATGIEGDFHKYVEESDFTAFFHRDELAGRILQYAYVNSLSEEVMVDILMKAKDSPFSYFANYFSHRDIQLTITLDGAKAIAAYANRKHLGVRGLKSTMFKLLNEEMFRLDRNEIIIDKQFVDKKIA